MPGTATLSAPARRQPVPVRPAGPIDSGRLLLHATIWLGLAVTLGLWWKDTPPGSLHTSADLLTAGGRIAGLTGGYLLLIQVLLMSRLRVLDRIIGAHRLSRWHRDLGGYLLIVLLTHVALITLGYAAADRISPLRQIPRLLGRYQDMISALVALGVLVTLGLLAIRQIRRRLPYELWHRSHQAVYLVLLFAYGHQFNDGQQFVTSQAARYYWACLYFLVLAALLVGRVIRPLWINLRQRATVHAVVPETPGVVSIYVSGHHLPELRAQAGQFFRWRFADRAGWWRSHPFSLSAPPNERWLRLTVKAVGDHSERLQRLRPGTRVFLSGPFGAFTAGRRRGDRVLLIAAGSGIAPIRALLEALPRGSVRMIYRAHGEPDLLFRKEIDKLASARRHRVWYVVGDRDSEEVRDALTPHGLRRVVRDVALRDVYVCGPPGFTATVLAALSVLEVPRNQIHLDPFEL